ncbi:hypothetical protein EDD11_009217 [Mortierella claussenii]|nr:hypothetical protein EDD11_009217 [Mortierella claussenii]
MSTELSKSSSSVDDTVGSSPVAVAVAVAVPATSLPSSSVSSPSLDTTASVVAAVSASTASSLQQPQQPIDTPPLAAAPATATPEEKARREAINQKVRNENRERKKRWREANEDRNKDNDLRCRVNKRANKLFTKADKEGKQRWIEEEFAKRQSKRKEKERKRKPCTPNDKKNLEDAAAQLHTPAKQTLTLTEQLALHHAQAAAAVAANVGSNVSNSTIAHGVTNSQRIITHQQLQETANALNMPSSEVDINTVKTAMALNDLVKKTSGIEGHLDLAQLTGVLSDPNLARQLFELEAAAVSIANPVAQGIPTSFMNNGGSSATGSTVALPMVEPVVANASQMLDSEYPMDAVLTLMQLNGSWKA